jgi:hypothetical protein
LREQEKNDKEKNTNEWIKKIHSKSLC